MSTAMRNFTVWRERHQARHDHERLGTDETTNPLQAEHHELTQQPLSASSDTPIVETVSEDSDDEGDVENQREPVSPDPGTETTPVVVTVRERPRRSVSLADLEEERELSRRRTSACVLLAIFILFRLWIQAVATGDFFLLLLCLVGTSWTTKFIRHTREREEALERLIQEYSEGSEGDVRNDTRMLSFEEQLSRAIMDSQRMMMEGGYGNPDGSAAGSGVSENARSRWDRFQYSATPEVQAKVGYGSVGHEECEKDDTQSSEDEPHCSICLSEYEDGETLVGLPCKHIYHEDCLSSWCTNHIRCPLCNLDLESEIGDSSSEEP